MEPGPTMSVGLNSNFAKNAQMTSIQYNPMNDLEDEKQTKTAKKIESTNQLLSEANRLPRDGSNSQRSFRIRKGYIRSISRGSN